MNNDENNNVFEYFSRVTFDLLAIRPVALTVLEFWWRRRHLEFPAFSSFRAFAFWWNDFFNKIREDGIFARGAGEISRA